MENTSLNTQIHTLEEIVERKNMVLNSLHNDDKKIKELWTSLFQMPNMSAATPTKRITSIINIGTGVIDGALLAWKLYHRFKGKKKRR